MAIKIVLMILALTKADILQLMDIIDGYGENPIHQCVFHHVRCNPYFETPCCENNQTCRLVGWNADLSVFACTDPVRLGDYCENNLDCFDIYDAICSKNKKCECMPNFSKRKDGKCVLIEEACVRDEECAVKNSVCSNHRCICKFSYTSDFINQCIPTKLDTACNNDYDCKDLMHIKCSENKTCTCRPHHIIKNDATCASLLGGYCQHDEQCGVENSICSDYKCRCKDKYILTSPEICSPTPLGEGCNYDYDCNKILYTKCSNDSKCVCKENYIAINDTLCAPLLGEFCLHDELCAVNNSHCIDSVCQCKANFKSIFNTKCVPTNFGKSCTELFDCEDILHLYCSDKYKCECKKNHILINNSTCLPLLDEYCWVYEKCAPENSICSFNTCRCKVNYLQRSNNRCIPRNSTSASVTGGFCDDYNICVSKNSACVDNKCQSNGSRMISRQFTNTP